MTFVMDSNVQEFCTFCYKVLCYSDILTVNEDIMLVLKGLTDNKIDTTTVQNSPLCQACLENMRVASNFKTSLESLRIEATIGRVKEEFFNEKTFITCWSCKNSVKLTSAVPLQDYSHLGDVVKNLIPKQNIEELDVPQICELCQKSLLNLYSVVNLIVTLCASRANQATNEHQNDELMIKYEPPINNSADMMIDDIKQEPNIKIETLLKEEVEGEQDEVHGQEFQIKQEELDLKMDPEEEHSGEGVWNLDEGIEDRLNKARNIEIQMLTFKSNEMNSTKYKGRCNQHSIAHKTNSESEKFKCDQCEYQTNQKTHLRSHLIVHKAVGATGIFRCHECEYRTNYKRALRNHMLIHKEMFQCLQCKYKTKQKKNLARHMLVHKGVGETRLFGCDQCEFQTKHKDGLKKHMLIHKGVGETKIFKCGHCQFQTKHKRNLDRHMLVHKSVDEIELFNCDQCEYQTKRKYYLKNHMLIHNILRCEYCEIQAKSKRGLRKHMSVHKGLM